MKNSRTRNVPATKQGMAQVLRSIFLFKDWSTADLERIAPMAAHIERQKGDILFSEGGECTRLCVLLEGRAQLFRTRPNGSGEVTLHMLTGPCLVACAALFLDHCYPATARIVSDRAELVTVSGQPFLEMLDQKPDLARRMISALASRLGELADLLENRAGRGAAARLAGWLLEQPSVPGAQHARIVRLPSAKKTLAEWLGMAPETFSRSLRVLTQHGAIVVRGRVIEIRDPNALLHAASE